MILPSIKAGSTSNMITFPIYDSSSTTGALLTGLAYNTASLVAYYGLESAASVTAITLATATAGTYTSGGFVVRDATNATGYYQLGIPDAACTTAGNLTIKLSGATNMVPVTLTIPIVANLVSDLFSSTINTTGPLPYLGILDSGTAQTATATSIQYRAATPLTANTAAGVTTVAYGSTQGYYQVRTDTAYVGSTQTATVDTWDVTPTGIISYLATMTPPASASSPAPANMTQIGGVTQSATDLKDFADTGYDPATHKVQGVILTDTLTTYTGNTPQTGDAYARLGAPAGASVSADIAAVTTAIGGVKIKKNTALAGFPFVMVDSTDHVTPKTTLTVTATRSLDGAAFATCANAVTELGNGVYLISLAATDLNADTVTLRFTATGADDRLITIVTQAV